MKVLVSITNNEDSYTHWLDNSTVEIDMDFLQRKGELLHLSDDDLESVKKIITNSERPQDYYPKYWFGRRPKTFEMPTEGSRFEISVTDFTTVRDVVYKKIDDKYIPVIVLGYDYD